MPNDKWLGTTEDRIFHMFQGEGEQKKNEKKRLMRFCGCTYHVRVGMDELRGRVLLLKVILKTLSLIFGKRTPISNSCELIRAFSKTANLIVERGRGRVGGLVLTET